MNDINNSKHQAVEVDEFVLPLPAPIVLGTEATKAVAGGIIRPGLCTTCGLMQPHPTVEQLA
jgi:hypothetical protein